MHRKSKKLDMNMTFNTIYYFCRRYLWKMIICEDPVWLFLAQRQFYSMAEITIVCTFDHTPPAYNSMDCAYGWLEFKTLASYAAQALYYMAYGTFNIRPFGQQLSGPKFNNSSHGNFSCMFSNYLKVMITWL